jgi:hypothetical protein
MMSLELTSKTKWLHDDLGDISRQLDKQNKLIKEGLRMFKCIDLDGEARGDLSLSKEYRDKLEEIKRVVGVKTLSEAMEMLIDDKVEYFNKAFKEETKYND